MARHLTKIDETEKRRRYHISKGSMGGWETERTYSRYKLIAPIMYSSGDSLLLIM